MKDKLQTYYHWVMTSSGKYYLGYDFYMGYETLYDVDKKLLASKFYSSTPFDKRDWIKKKDILEEGVERASK